MVSYCCVKGCSNNSNNKKKDPTSAVSFHSFPSNPELKSKWLRAIGRPHWDPPSHVRICSAHFSYDQISHDNVRARIVDHACPVNELPPNSNFEASKVEICRICLAYDVKMYSLEVGILKTCIESVTGLNQNYNIEGLPQFICYECAAILRKCYNLVEKSLVAQTTLLDIFAKHGQITRSFVKSKNREGLNLTSSLHSHHTTPSKIYHFQYDDVQNISLLINSGPDNYKTEKELLENDICELENDSNVFNVQNTYKIEEETCKIEDEGAVFEEDDRLEEEDDVETEDEEDKTSLSVVARNIKLQDEIKLEDQNILKIVKKKNIVETKKNGASKKETSEIKLEEQFDIVKLTSLQEQIDEWKKSITRRLNGKQIHVCEVCSKTFAHDTSYRTHIAVHDPSRGDAECPVCKIRFKSDKYARLHTNYHHAKKLYCKSCPKTFNTGSTALKHMKWHEGHRYKCSQCPYSSVHASALYAHVRQRHEQQHACALCGRSFGGLKGLRLHCAVAHGPAADVENNQLFRCDECDIGFASEGARRVHILTATQHKKRTSLLDPIRLDPSLKTTCRTCGAQFQNKSKLHEHQLTEHAKQKRNSWTLPDDCYPKQCEHCDVRVENRKEHWMHVRRRHPSEKHSYKRVITAVCETCGKGFQNTTKLQIHELRHQSPSVRCELCPKLFYDKFRLAQHLAVHSDARPHRCRLCGRSFKLRGNLERHHKVHTDEATYECTLCSKMFKYSTSLNLHVRSVHHKIPPPPRKRRRAKNPQAHSAQ